ncbi:MAG: hypothetical protein MMC23_003304 [Stictis urceolatum]|nr:hypothetical protein [Stictis urceolata]
MTTRRQGGLPAEFLSTFFYDGKMKSMAPKRQTTSQIEDYMQQRFKVNTSLAFFDVPDTNSYTSGASCSKSNDTENETILDLAIDLHSKTKIGFDNFVWLTPYDANVRAIERLIETHPYVKGYSISAMKVSTIDGFQGEQAEIILLGTTNSYTLGFMHEIRRQCVAFTRLRSAMLVFQNWSDVSKRKPRDDGHWWKMVAWLQAHKFFFELKPSRGQDEGRRIRYR